jgi:hypothetical protein
MRHGILFLCQQWDAHAENAVSLIRSLRHQLMSWLEKFFALLAQDDFLSHVIVCPELYLSLRGASATGDDN